MLLRGNNYDIAMRKHRYLFPIPSTLSFCSFFPSREKPPPHQEKRRFQARACRHWSVAFTTDMFSGCSSLTSLDVSNFNTSNVTSHTRSSPASSHSKTPQTTNRSISICRASNSQRCSAASIS